MNKDQLTQKVAEVAGVSKATVTHVINVMQDVITDAVQDGQEVKLSQFGRFFPYETKSRMGRNPRTGETFPVASKRFLKFKPYVKLK